jgi:CheY-like chemotaxis protein
VTGPPTPSSDAILVADDSNTILAMVSSRLTRAGYDVVTATSGDEALRLALELGPRLVLLDVDMPGLDGLEVARRLRADENLGRTPIIMLTANDAPEEIERGKAAGADDYVTKPFSPQELETSVERLLASR